MTLLFQRVRYTEPIRYRVYDDGRYLGLVWRDKKAWTSEAPDGLPYGYAATREAAGKFLISQYQLSENTSKGI